MTSPRTCSEFAAAAPLTTRVGAILVAIMGCALSAKLWPQWSGDPNLSHGFLAPIACLLLLAEGRRSGPWRWLNPPEAALTSALFGVLALAALAVAGLFAAALDWWNSMVDFTLASAFALIGIAAIAVLADARTRLLPWNWPTLLAALLWPLAAPLPPGTTSRLTLGLQLWISDGVLRTLHLLGVAAHRDGNILELANGSVGVEEACSGVRSLVSCVFVGLLFSAILTRRRWPRVLLIALTAPLALVSNFIRSLFLTLLVNRGVSIEGTWHDATGYAVLGATALMLGALGALLRDSAPPEAGSAQESPLAESRRLPASSTILLACATLCAVLVALFWVKTRPAIRASAPAPDLVRLLPDAFPGWRVITPDDLYRFKDVLRTDHLVERTYVRTVAGGAEEITFYAAYWRAGQATVTLVSTHTPDACWPGAGWVAHPELGGPAGLTDGGRPLAAGEHRVFTHGAFSENVWFWHLYDGRAVVYEDPRSAAALLGAALRYGFRKEGDQLFVRVSSNRSWPDLQREPLVQRFFANTRDLGL